MIIRKSARLQAREQAKPYSKPGNRTTVSTTPLGAIERDIVHVPRASSTMANTTPSLNVTMHDADGASADTPDARDETPSTHQQQQQPPQDQLMALLSRLTTQLDDVQKRLVTLEERGATQVPSVNLEASQHSSNTQASTGSSTDSNEPRDTRRVDSRDPHSPSSASGGAPAIADRQQQPKQQQQSTHSANDADRHEQQRYTQLPSSAFELPSFDGLPEQWLTFIAAYQRSSDAFGLNALQNVFRLQKCLKGEAHEAVEYLLTLPDSADDIIDELRFRYGRPDILADCWQEKVLSTPDITEKHIQNVIVFSSKVKNMVAALNTTDNRHILAESSLLRKLVGKLPPSKQLDWVEKAKSVVPRATVVHFSWWLTNLAESVTLLPKTNTAAPTSTSRATASSTSQQQRSVVRQQPRPMFLATTGTSTCCMCSRSHRLIDCDRFHGLLVPDRWNVARRNRLCFGCLRAGHIFDICRSKRPCPADSCPYLHHELLHTMIVNADATQATAPTPDEHAPTENASVESERTSDALAAPAVAGTSAYNDTHNPFNRPSSGSSVVHVCNERTRHDPVLLRILPVTLCGPRKHIDTFALMDDGSSLTLVEEEVANELGLTGPRTTLSMQWIGGRSTSQSSREVALGIIGCGVDAPRFTLQNVRTVRGLSLPTQSLALPDDDDRFDHVRHLSVATYQNAKPTILLGLDNSDLGVPLQTTTSVCGGPIATRTPLGWVVYGRQASGAAMPRVMVCANVDDANIRLEMLMREYLAVESSGIATPSRMIESDDDARARRILGETARRVGARYEVGLLWRCDQVKLPDSLPMARRRLRSVQLKMRRDIEYGVLYRGNINNYIAKGYARRLTPAEAAVRSDRTWFLPHFGVQPANKPGKFRLVFDAAAAVEGTSLNSALLKGPDLNVPLAEILFRFRMRTVGVCADIAEMFHQVLVRKEDRCSQRFLWCPDGDVGEPAQYEMLAMTFGAACSPTAAQFIKNLNADEHQAKFPAAAEAIRSSHYVDDLVCSFSSAEEAISVSRDIIEVHRRGGFLLRGFVSNDARVASKLNELATITTELMKAEKYASEENAPEQSMERDVGVSTKIDDDAKRNREIDVSLLHQADGAGGGSRDMQLSPDETDKILGMMRRTTDDAFTFAMQFVRVDPAVVAGTRAPTKREILSAVMSVFDPFGFLADIVLPAKVIVQDLWRAAVGWDDLVDDRIFVRWRAWCQLICAAREVRIPRCYSACFTTSDSVELHMFADASETAYAAVGYWRIGGAQVVQLAFVMGKTKCAPVKKLSIPRLELQAAVLAIRLLQSIRRCHPINIKRVVLWSDSRTVVSWIQSTARRYKPYVAHRVAEIVDVTEPSWWKWLPTEHNVADDATRVKQNQQMDVNSRWLRGPEFLLADERAWPADVPGDIIDDDERLSDRFVGVVQPGEWFDVRRFTSFDELVRTMAWVRRFVANIRARLNNCEQVRGGLSSEEVRGGTHEVCRIVQQEAFTDELIALKSNKPIAKSSDIRTLMPYVDADGLLRLFGRTDAADKRYLPASAQRPILLPKRHHFTGLLVMHIHRRFAHQFDNGVISMVRQEYWVPSLRTELKRVRSNCGLCKLRAARPRPPVAGQLPPDRLAAYSHPFTYTGLDFFGPFTVSVGRRHEKRWVALFTCLTTRAMHLELAADLSTDACLLCLRNFCNTRGVPTRIRSDCGTNFVGADNILRRTADFFDVDEIGRELSTRGVQWLFNCPANPEAGGAWERLVQSAKRVLNVTLKEVAPRVETLRSLLIEAANIINSRPLTHLAVSPADDQPITPNHFLLGRANFTAVPGPINASALCTTKQWRISEQLKNRFWAQFVRDYLPELTRRSKYYEDVRPLAVGVLVLICDADHPRSRWTRGRVKEVMRGSDGRVRTATVETSSGVVRRPVTKLAVLNVESEPRG